MVKKTKKPDYQNKIAELEESYKRVLADYHNLERRQKEAQSDLVKMANATLIEKLLLVLDSLVLAQNHLKDKGLKIVIDQFEKILASEGLEKIKSDDQEFDPILMDCVEVVSGKHNVVVSTSEVGFTLYGKVLRPAKVKVGNSSNQ